MPLYVSNEKIQRKLHLVTSSAVSQPWKRRRLSAAQKSFTHAHTHTRSRITNCDTELDTRSFSEVILRGSSARAPLGNAVGAHGHQVPYRERVQGDAAGSGFAAKQAPAADVQPFFSARAKWLICQRRFYRRWKGRLHHHVVGFSVPFGRRSDALRARRHELGLL